MNISNIPVVNLPNYSTYGICSAIAKNLGYSDVSAFDESRQAQPAFLSRDVVVIQRGGGKPTTTTVIAGGFQAWGSPGIYRPCDYQDKYNAKDALIFNYAMSVRPDIPQYQNNDPRLQSLGNIEGSYGGFNLVIGASSPFDKFHADKATVTGLSSDMSIEDFLAHVQANGLDRAINWTNVANTLSFDPENVNANTFSAYTDYAASVYATLENRIKNDFTGEEQQTQLSKLNEVFTAKTKEFSEIFYNQSLSWLKDYEGENYIAGVSENKLKASIDNVFEEKINNFRGVISKNPDFAGIKGTDDEWLERDVRFMANRLLEAAGNTTASTASGLINEKDLLDMTRLAEAFNLKTAYDSHLSGGEADEEIMGLVVGSKVLKAVWLADEKSMSDKVRTALQKMAGDFINSEFERLNKENESLTKSLGANNLTQKQLGKLDKQAVLNIINNLLEEYSKSKNAFDALQKTAAFAYKIHMEKAGSSDYKNLLRYGSESKNNVIHKTGDGGYFWQNFYEPKKPIPHSYSPANYRPCMSNILKDWEMFASAIK